MSPRLVPGDARGAQRLDAFALAVRSLREST